MELRMDLIKLILFAIIIIFVTIHLKRYLTMKLRQYYITKNFYGPKGYPIIGNTLVFLGDLNDITNKIKAIFEKFIYPVRLWIGLQLFIVVNDPDQYKAVTESPHGLEKIRPYQFMNPIMKNGLLSSSGPIWKVHRKLLNPSFADSVILSMTDKIVKHSNRLLKILENSNEKEIHASESFHICLLDIIYDTYIGLDLNLQNIPNCEYHKDFTESIKMIIERMYKIWLKFDFIYYNLPVGKKFLKRISNIDEITYKVIRKKKESLLENKMNQELKENNAGEDSNPFLDTLFESLYYGGEYTEKDIRDEINTTIFAGSDTSSNAVSFAILLLAIYPEIQEKAYKELYNIYGSSDPEDVHITKQDVREMKYLERVIKETLRLFPPAPFVGRFVSEDIKVAENKVIPKNSNVMFIIYYLHRDEKYWTDPLKFNPDRFLPGNYNSNYFRPFGCTKRNCIGQVFAMHEMKILIATVLRKFIIRIDEPMNLEDIPVTFGLTLQLSRPVLLRFIRR